MEVEVPDGYMKFGNSASVGASAGAGAMVEQEYVAGIVLEDVIEEPAAFVATSSGSGYLAPSPARSPVSRSPVRPAVPHIVEMDDTSELARASEAISISGNAIPSPVAQHHQQLQEYASNATPVADSSIDDAVNVSSSIALPPSSTVVGIPGGGSPFSGGVGAVEEEEEAMITSEAEAEARVYTHRMNRVYEDGDGDDEVDEDGHPIDPARRYRNHGSRSREDRDEEEEEEVNAHIGSV